MSQVQHPGTYAGRLIDWTMDESKNGLPQFVVTFALVGFWNGTDWTPTQGGEEIRAYFNLIKKDKTRNDVTIEMLMKVLGWNGESFQALHDGDYSKLQCQVEVKWDEYMGQKRLRVAWINPGDYEGAKLERKDTSTVQSMDAKWGAALKTAGSVVPARPSRALPAANVLERGSAVSQLSGAAAAPAEDLDIKEENIPF